MKIVSRATPEGLAGHMWPAGNSLSTTAVNFVIFFGVPPKSSLVICVKNKNQCCSFAFCYYFYLKAHMMNFKKFTSLMSPNRLQSSKLL